MKFLKKFYEWKKVQIQNPESILGVWIVFGVLFGLAIDNIGAGIAIGVAIGVSLYAKAEKALKGKKDKK